MNTLSTIPFLFPDGNYDNIISINNLPQGPLRKFVRRVPYPRLSNLYTQRDRPSCILAIVSPFIGPYRNVGRYERYLVANDYPYLFEYLTSHGYIINSAVTEMMNRSPVRLSNETMLCFIQYQPCK